MPKKSLRARQASSQRSANSYVFVSKKQPQEELEDAWCSDDDLVPIESFLVDNSEADVENSVEQNDEEFEFEITLPDEESLKALIKDVGDTAKLWREKGFNTGLRGYGTSKRTYHRRNAEIAKRVATASSCSRLDSWLGSSSISLVRKAPPDLRDKPEEPIVDLSSETCTGEVETDEGEVDYSEFCDIFDEILECRIDGGSSGSSSVRKSRDNVVVECRYTRMEAITALLDNEAKVTRNVAIESKRGLEHYQIMQAAAIVKYLQLLEEGKPVMKASLLVASILYRKQNHNSYKARCIRGWAAHYLEKGELKKYLQGKNVKTSSIITDENIASLMKSHLRLMKDEDRSPTSFQALLNESLLSEIPNAPRMISIKTATRWMYHLGFQPKKQTKGYYTDNHNRDDVIKYRDEVFLPQMLCYERRMIQYEGEDMMTEVLPDLIPGERQIVLITHDETTCYCCEGKPMMWMEDGKNKLLPKTKGASIMISGFACKCHGFFEEIIDGKPVRSFQFFEAGTARDGWFTNAHLVAQIEMLTPLFQKLHPTSEIVIAFDNSMTHHAKV